MQSWAETVFTMAMKTLLKCLCKKNQTNVHFVLYQNILGSKHPFEQTAEQGPLHFEKNAKCKLGLSARWAIISIFCLQQNHNLYRIKMSQRKKKKERKRTNNKQTKLLTFNASEKGKSVIQNKQTEMLNYTCCLLIHMHILTEICMPAVYWAWDNLSELYKARSNTN